MTQLSEKWARMKERVAREQAVEPVCRFCKGQKELRSPRNPERVVPCPFCSEDSPHYDPGNAK